MTEPTHFRGERLPTLRPGHRWSMQIWPGGRMQVKQVRPEAVMQHPADAVAVLRQCRCVYVPLDDAANVVTTWNQEKTGKELMEQNQIDPTEALAAYAHEAWSGWMKYMFSKSAQNQAGDVTIPAALVARWVRQMTTDYADLPESEKASDRAEAEKMLKIINSPNHEI